MRQGGRSNGGTFDFRQRSKRRRKRDNLFEGDCDLSVNEIPSDVKSYFVGSEGGFSEKEISLAKEKGIKTVSLGKRILRAETASVVATTLVQLKTGGLL